jgi:hypothetical protein
MSLSNISEPPPPFIQKMSLETGLLKLRTA